MVGKLEGRQNFFSFLIEGFYRHRLRQKKAKSSRKGAFSVNASRRRGGHLHGPRVGFEGLPILGQPSPNRPSAVRTAHSAARRGRASHSHFCSKACAPTPQLAQSAAFVAICLSRARVAMSDQTPLSAAPVCNRSRRFANPSRSELTSATKACYSSHLNYTSVSKEAKHVER